MVSLRRLEVVPSLRLALSSPLAVVQQPSLSGRPLPLLPLSSASSSVAPPAKGTTRTPLPLV